MAIINDTAGDEAGVEASPVNALRITSVDSLGNVINRAYDGTYESPINIVPTTLTDGIALFAIFNTSATKKVRVDSVDLNYFFAGTAAATRSLFKLSRFAGNVPTGVAPSDPVKHDTVADATSVVQCFDLATGLTVSGVETRPILVFGGPNQLTTSLSDRFEFPRPLVLQPNQGLVLQNLGAVVAGATLLGAIQWREGA